MIRQLAIWITLSVALTGCDEIPDPSLPNEPPVARDDNVSLKQNEVTLVDFLFNDTDIDGDPLAIVITQDPVNGTLEESNGLYFYTPALYFVGTDEFSYEITDLANHTASATVFIEVEKKEVWAIFGTDDGVSKEVYSVDSRDPATLIDLAQAVPDGENVLDWAISRTLRQAVFLTDADRVLAVDLEDPSTLAGEFDVDTTSGAIDGSLVLSVDGDAAYLSLDNRYIVFIALDGTGTLEFDSGFETGTMTPTAISPLETSAIMEGTLGEAGDERSAIYVAPLSTTAPIPVLDDPAILDSTFTRILDGLNAMLWLTEDTATAVPPAAYSCTTPPPQTLSVPSYTSLGLPDPGVDLIEASGLLADPTAIISYNNGPDTDGLYVAACPPETELFQIVEIPYLDPASARIVATATDASDGLWNVDVGPQGVDIIYTLEGDTGLRTVAISLAEIDPVETDLSASVADYQTYTDGADTRIPPSVITTDALRWVFLAPVADALTRLGWLQLQDLTLETLDLPFTATNVVSNGLHALVQGETGGAGSAPVALIEFADPQVVAVEVDGVLAETLSDPLNQFESAVQLITIP